MHTYSDTFDVYDVEKLWKIAPKSEWASVDDFKRCLDDNIWATGKTPNEHLKDKNGPEWSDMLRADLRYAIIVTPDNYIADGNHRFMKAVHSGKKKIKIRRFNSYEDMESAIVKR